MIGEGETITMPARHLLAFAAALAVTPAAAQAHHSFAAFFDPNKSVTITGTVTEFRFTNPHGMVALDVKKPDGSIEKWRAETNAPVVLVRRGWNRDIIKPGQVVTIDGWPSRDGRNYIRLRDAKDANGKEIGSLAFGQKDQS
jgi:DNA/RNA endonuclease YhcR with UshA esterase domain